MVSSKPRVVHIIPQVATGGVEIAALSMAKAASDNFAVVAIGNTGANGSNRVLSGPYRTSNHPLAHLAAIKNVLLFKPDVIVCSLWRSVPVALFSKALRPRAKLVSFIHNAGYSNALDRALHALIGRFADEFWCDSHATQSARIPAEKQPASRVISFVLDKDLLRHKQHEGQGPKFVTWGRLRHQKGVDRALRFIAALVSQGVDATFDIYGPDAGAKSELVQLCDELGLSARVRFLGAIDRADLKGIAGRYSFFLQLSRREGMAMATVEAMQLGLVPVVTPVGEMQFYCQDGSNAVVVDDQFGAATAKIIEAINSPDTYERMSLAAASKWADAKLYHQDFADAAMNLVSYQAAKNGSISRNTLPL